MSNDTETTETTETTESAKGISLSQFDSGEDAIETNRAFIAKQVSDLSTEELYNELERLRATRVAKRAKTVKRTKQEKSAAKLHEVEMHLPVEYRAVYRNLTPEQKKAFLEKLVDMQGDEEIND